MPTLRTLLALVTLVSPVFACGGAADRPAPTVTKAATPAPAAPVGDDALAERYLAVKERFGALLPQDAAGPKRILAEDGAGLREVAESAKDVHLRANASLLLGTLHEGNGDLRSAISFYRQAASLLPGEAGPSRVLALALGRDNQFAAALVEQKKVVADDADDLEAWLLVGELAVKANDTTTATDAYAGYEMRRKGLIDGLTLKAKDGPFTLPPDQRAGCARALIPARDNGTAVALLYSLSIETDPVVRLAVVEAMGAQRLAGYKQALTDALPKETNQEVKEAIGWALAEIQRDPLDTKPGPAPAGDAKATDPASPDAKTPADAASPDAKTAVDAKADAKAAPASDAKAPAAAPAKAPAKAPAAAPSTPPAAPPAP